MIGILSSAPLKEAKRISTHFEAHPPGTYTRRRLIN